MTNLKALRAACEQLGARFVQDKEGREYGWWTLKTAAGEPVANVTDLEDALDVLRTYFGGHERFEEILQAEGLTI